MFERLKSRYRGFWDKEQADASRLAEQLAAAMRQKLAAESPPDGCPHQYVGRREYCGRRLFEGSPYCYWHHPDTSKYTVDAVTKYFGDGTTLKSAIELEAKD